MATDPKSQPSFSPGRKWKIGTVLLVRTALALAIVVMLNYLGAQFFQRFYWSAQTSTQLSSRTRAVLNTLTNQVNVTLYYDRNNDFYPEIASLLNEYHLANPKISVRTVDYLRDAAEAEKIKEQYGLNSAAAKNLIIFDCGHGRFKIASGDALVKYAPTGYKDKKLVFGAVAFNGEQVFTSILLTLESDQRFKAYFLQGDGEAAFNNSGNLGYLKFAMILEQNYVTVTNLNLLGAQDIPADCDLLIIAAPTQRLSESELQKISDYLKQGGRLLALFNYNTRNQSTGLEPILQRWGVNVGMGVVKDQNNTTSSDVLVVTKFGHHPIVNALAGNDLSLQMVLPRPISAVHWENQKVDAPQVTELAFSGPDSVLTDNPAAPPQSYPLAAAVEQKNPAGVASPRGGTRILVVGDSLFLSNFAMGASGNRDFAVSAINWLLNRPNLVEGIGPRPVKEFRLMLTQTQRREVCWLLLAALPGAVLLLGGLAWLARRK